MTESPKHAGARPERCCGLCGAPLWPDGPCDICVARRGGRFRWTAAVVYFAVGLPLALVAPAEPLETAAMLSAIALAAVAIGLGISLIDAAPRIGSWFMDVLRNLRPSQVLTEGVGTLRRIGTQQVLDVEDVAANTTYRVVLDDAAVRKDVLGVPGGHAPLSAEPVRVRVLAAPEQLEEPVPEEAEDYRSTRTVRTVKGEGIVVIRR